MGFGFSGLITTFLFFQSSAAFANSLSLSLNLGTCQTQRLQVSAACCRVEGGTPSGGGQTGFSSAERERGIRTVHLPNCSPNPGESSSIPIQCVDDSISLPTRESNGGSVSPSAACNQAVASYEDRCGTIGEISCEQLDSSFVDALPLCSQIEPLEQELAKQCEAIRLPDLPSIARGLLPPSSSSDDSSSVFTRLPNDLTPERNRDPGRLPPPASTLLAPNQQTQVVASPRIELPENTFRYFTTRTVFAQIVERLSANPNFQCNSQTLTCKMNPILMAQEAGLLEELTKPDPIFWIRKAKIEDSVLKITHIRLLDRELRFAAAIAERERRIIEVQEDAREKRDECWEVNRREAAPNSSEARARLFACLADIVVEDVPSQPKKKFAEFDWYGVFEVKMVRNPRFTLGQNNNWLSFKNSHAILSEGGFASQTEGHHLTSAFLLTGLSDSQCSTLKYAKFAGTDAIRDDQFVPFRVPYWCECGGRGAPLASFNRNVCVLQGPELPDGFPRPFTDQLTALPKRRFLCNREPALGDIPLFAATQSNRLEIPNTYEDAIQVLTRSPRFTFSAWKAWEIIGKLRSFGCTAAQVAFSEMSTPTETTRDGIDQYQVKLRPNAAGIEFTTQLDPGRMRASLSSFGFILMNLDFSVRMETKTKNIFKKFGAWFVKLVSKIVQAVVNVAANAVLQILNIVSGAVIPLDFDFDADPVAAQATILVSTRDYRSVDVFPRYFKTTEPTLKKVVPNYRWEVSACQISDLKGPIDFIKKFFMATAGCLAQQVQNLLKFTAGLVMRGFYEIAHGMGTKFHGKLVEWVADKWMSPLVVSGLSSAISSQRPMQQISQAAKKFVLPGELSAGTGVPRVLPYPLNQLCTFGSHWGPICQFYGALADGMLKAGGSLAGIGAKSHYRSVSAMSSRPPRISREFPPVNFCDIKEVIPGSTPWTAAAWSASKLNFDFKYSGASDPMPRDWRSQCAVFFDFDSNVNYSSRDYLAKISWTRRSELLVSEVFFCKKNSDCDPTYIDPALAVEIPDHSSEGGASVRASMSPIGYRSALALCSLLADVQYQPVTGGEWRSVFRDVETATSRSRVNAFLQQLGFSDEDVSSFRSQIQACQTLLTQGGWRF
jgi:hypothetical protein